MTYKQELNVNPRKSEKIDNIIEGLKSGNQRTLARAISLVENGDDIADAILDRIFSSTGKAIRIGITGPPGAGKSTLTSKIAKGLRGNGKTIGIVAVDPTSPFSGGAVLGDRIRMSELAGYPDIFIRSMATRGSLGGLSKTAQEVADLMDAAGMEIIIFETVGVGQGELDVARATDSTIVVLVPESGDSIQAMKAGLMEIADIFVINKADREGAEKIKIELELMLDLRSSNSQWKPVILKTIANQAQGIEEVIISLEKHRKSLISEGILKDKRHQRALEKIRQMVRNELEEKFWNQAREAHLRQNISKVLDHSLSPHNLAEELIHKY